jgi:hypothetical protein
MGIVGLDLPRKKDMSADNTTTSTANTGSSSTSTT